MLPGAIIFVNNDLTDGVMIPLIRQLYINESMTGSEFDLRVLEDPSYPQVIHNSGMRVLIIRDFSEGYNRSLADVAIFIKAGLASIEANKFGPPGQTYRVDKLTIYDLLRTYPISGTLPVPATVQNNILVPMFPNPNLPKLYPFGTDSGSASGNPGGKGADVDSDDWF